MEGAVGGSGLGLMRGEVRLAPSTPSWPAAYERVGLKLRAALRGFVVAVEHVGSTAVPGLPDKPILDVAVGLRADADRDTVVEVLELPGFIHRGTVEEDDGPNLMFGWEDIPRHRVVNLHVVSHAGRQWHEWMVFRDRLRADSRARAAYAQLKADLARRFPNNRQAYIAGKDAFVERILAT
ncbi:GrpB-like predicted nucleotidyltransferase (UPF0157 family) [Kribbella sp. VKM Ac-2569]|uniref:GrpB family protein n=1 Tax=Kribbella sp. VKM Ac-2569 TaxID=2512220 RepID=UPI00102AEC5C|nr:GrpB family protein [Kribbella sp. VKM Ac-2569]RZT12711.1 GrpB-like predicted nucleotidyltransferase (UPF0157 family) [Kribbella sp. VKM Ac-2569]